MKCGSKNQVVCARCGFIPPGIANDILMNISVINNLTEIEVKLNNENEEKEELRTNVKRISGSRTKTRRKCGR